METDQKNRIVQAMRLTWDYIGADILTCTEECGGEPVVNRDKVVEVCSDHVEIAAKLSRDDLDAYFALHSTERDELDKEAFPFERYGW